MRLTTPEPSVDARTALYVARQPILDASGAVFGYELLYRASAGATSCETATDVASARVLTDAVLTLGLEALTNGRPAFLNLTRSLLVDPVSALLPPDAAVFELHENIPVDAEVVEVCRALSAAGYRLALDDFMPGSDAEALLPFVRFVKVDVLATPPHLLGPLAARLRSRGIQCVAEKVETGEVFDATRNAGYELFQGYYFSRPAMRSAACLPAQQRPYLRLLAALNSPGVTIREIEALVKEDASLCYRVLRCINSAAYGLKREVHSIGQALVLLGLEPIRKWTAVWCLAGLNGGISPELVTMALVRARACEILAERAAAGQELFLIGLFSLLDAMLGRPMAEVVRDLPLSSGAKGVLLGDAAPARRLLDAVLAYERGAWEEATDAAAGAGVPLASLAAAYNDGLRWARELSR